MDALEAESLRQARAAFEAHPHDIACFIAEPIQGEGGDRHFRPQFFAAMRELCDEFDALLIFDEVQTGCGLTGTPWAYQQLGVTPDVVAFGKKTQVCGDHGRPPGRRGAGQRVRGELADQLDLGRQPRRHGAVAAHPRDHRVRRADGSGGEGRSTTCSTGSTSSPPSSRDWCATFAGRGLMCAFSLPSSGAARRADRPAVGPSGDHAGQRSRDSVRFRPALTVSREEIDAAVDAVRDALR